MAGTAAVPAASPRAGETPAVRGAQSRRKTTLEAAGRFLRLAAIGPVEQVDRVNDLHGASAFLDLAGDLEDAADVARRDQFGPGRGEMVHLANAEAFGHLGLRQVVRSRGAAADLALLERHELNPWNHREQLARLGADLLAVAE